MRKTIPSQDPYGKRNAKLRGQPKCSKCGKTKAPDDFYRTEVSFWCRDCRRVYARELYHRRRAKLSDAEIRQLNDRLNERSRARRAERIASMTPKQLAAFRKHSRMVGKRNRDAAREKAYMAYGGYKCACCGETEPLFLSIDHINNDGARHRREHNLKTGEQLYRWLIRNKYPKGFQVLCMNCQWGKRNNKGVCPHMGKV